MMNIAPWMRFSACALLAALAGCLFAPDVPPPASLVKARRDEWQLKALPRRFEQTSLAAAVMGAGYWGGGLAGNSTQARAAAAPPPDMRWRIAAVFVHGKDRGALVVFEAPDKPAQRVRVGDVLPSGHRIERISEREVCVKIGRKSYMLGVERRE